MVGRKGITYGTHPLAPILSWMAPDRITRVSCQDSGSHYADEVGEKYASDGAVMLAKTEKGRLIKIRLDLVSASPGGDRYLLQGTRGVYEEHDGEGRLSFLQSDGKPGSWHSVTEAMQDVGWSCSDGLRSMDLVRMLADFVDGCRGGSSGLLGGVHEAMDLTMPGLVSEQSADADVRLSFAPISFDHLSLRVWMVLFVLSIVGCVGHGAKFKRVERT